MHCPMCGNKLEIHDYPKLEEIDWAEATDDEMAQFFEKQDNWPKRKECTCSNGCFGKDYPLYFHHPYRGPDSAPGDSWSLSWVK